MPRTAVTDPETLTGTARSLEGDEDLAADGQTPRHHHHGHVLEVRQLDCPAGRSIGAEHLPVHRALGQREYQVRSESTDERGATQRTGREALHDVRTRRRAVGDPYFRAGQRFVCDEVRLGAGRDERGPTTVHDRAAACEGLQKHRARRRAVGPIECA